MKKVSKILIFVLLVVAMCSCFAGCKPFDKPEFVTIEASQTAFLIPLVGDTTEQASFASEELLQQAMIAAKEIQIPHRWVKTGRSILFLENGEWRPSAKLIVVERTPETREWNSGKDEGTSSKNQAIAAESKESIGFSVGMNCSAQIYTEQDAVKFLYSYNNKTLAEIMDTEIRARVESDFVEMCAKYTMEEFLREKDTIMAYIREDATSYFAEKGITITVLGMKDGVEYDDDNVQLSINASYVAKCNAEAQAITNKANIDKANAEAEAMMIVANAEAESNRIISESLTPILLEKIWRERWSGMYPETVVGSDVMTYFGIN